MVLEELKEKAHSLPMAPGIYIMRDKSDKVIYVGKAKKLKNRVTQYFVDSANHSLKTRTMVSKVDHFEVIIAASEFEALVLECSLIKRYMPKYNILLKDDKGYPYVRLDMQEAYPTLSVVNHVAKDGADYYGPFGSRGLTNQIIDSIQTIYKLPTCKRKFPRDIGKDRPCLNHHMDRCMGWCQQGRTQDQYVALMRSVGQLLSGNYKKVAEEIRSQMLAAAEDLDFELAATLRDRLNAVEALGQKQLVTASSAADTDVIGYGETEAKACFTVLHFRGGNLLDKDHEVFPVPDDGEAAVSSLMKQYYLSRGVAPKRILLPFSVEDAELFSELLSQKFEIHVKLRVPQRGDNVRLVELANKNAREEVERVTTAEERTAGSLLLLGKMLTMEPPKRIESFDISNISGTDIVASMVVYENGRPQKSAYKKFKIKDLPGQDDYASMEQVLLRRFTHYQQEDKGFEELPDLLLIDGGQRHAQVAAQLLARLDIQTKVYGMVKDDRHRTRALLTADGLQVNIDSQQSVFSLIGNIQEETHRFAVGYHRQLRSKRLKYSELDNIPGIGPKRKQELLKHFKSINTIKNATVPELERYLPSNVAVRLYDHFRREEEE